MTLLSPKFRPRYRVEILKSGSVFLLSERESLFLDERLEQLLASLIDGRHTLEEIVEKVQPSLELEEASIQNIASLLQNAFNLNVRTRYALARMEEKGYIFQGDNYLPSELEVFCDHLKVDSKEAYYRLQSTRVAVKSLTSNLPISEFRDILESLQVKVSTDTDTKEADIEIILTDDYLRDSLDALNQKALNLSRPWMLVKPIGTSVWIGPMFDPGKTGCWQCLAQRIRGNRPMEEFIRRQKQTVTGLTPPLGFLAATSQTAIGMAATEIFKWIVQGGSDSLKDTVITHDTLSLETRRHVLVKRPQCPSCGENVDGLNVKPFPVVLGHRKKIFTEDGGHRCALPEETLSKYQHHVSPITGVIRGLNKVFTEQSGLVHAYVAEHHFLTMFDDLNGLHRNLKGRSAGKGRTDQQARVSGLCEAIERYSGVLQGDEIKHKYSYQTVEDRAIHPNDCMNFSQQQYQNREQWNSQCQGWFQKVPEPFDEEREIDWTPVWSLTHQEFKYLPTAYCYYGYRPSYKPDCWADSNGCAAGNTIEEAILQGFLELVERDSVALWWYNRLRKPQVNLDSFNNPYFQNLKQYHQTINRELWVLDLTSDLNIPVFAAISRRNDRKVEDIVLGYGAHLDPKIAISRALTEVNQVLPNVLFAQADGSTHYPSSADRLAIDWWKTATLESHPYLAADHQVTHKACSAYSDISSEDLLEDIELCQQRVEKKGMEMLVLEQTRPDIRLRVVKVIVPGMRHMWRRLNVGRLYEVPVEMGWLQEPLAEDQLNAFPMWM